jgi:hypothetical protein
MGEKQICFQVRLHLAIYRGTVGPVDSMAMIQSEQYLVYQLKRIRDTYTVVAELA